MAFLRKPFASDVPLPLRCGQVLLRPPQMADYEAWAALRFASRGFLQPYEPQWPADDLTRFAYRARVKRHAREIEAGAAYPFYVIRAADFALAGAVTLSNIRRGVAQTASLGYWTGEPFARQGLMGDAVQAVLAFAFGELQLHRVEAACLPDNAASVRLLEKSGFTEEGYARGYLKINGQWSDHRLFGLLAENWQEFRVTPPDVW